MAEREWFPELEEDHTLPEGPSKLTSPRRLSHDLDLAGCPWKRRIKHQWRGRIPLFLVAFSVTQRTRSRKTSVVTDSVTQNGWSSSWTSKWTKKENDDRLATKSEARRGREPMGWLVFSLSLPENASLRRASSELSACSWFNVHNYAR